MESTLNADQRTGLGHALARALIESADDAHALAFADAGDLAVSPLWGRAQRRARVRAELLAASAAVAKVSIGIRYFMEEFWPFSGFSL